MHLTLKIDTALPPKTTFSAQAKAFDQFLRIYNHVRPHESLSMKTPASLYRPSSRPFPSCTPRPQYPFADLRIIDAAGSIRFGVSKYFISSALAGETLGLYVLDDRYVEVRYCNLLLGMLDLDRLGRGLIRPWLPRKPKVSAMSPV